MLNAMLKNIYLIICLLHGSVCQHENTSLEMKNSTTSTPALRKMICNHIDSCQQSYNMEDQPDILIRSCKCDKQCSIYNDCCPDSEYNESEKRDEKFSCVDTPYDGYIYMVHKCPLHYGNIKMIRYCETTNKTAFIGDMLLFTPVTSPTKNITFKNMFCAFCNEELHFEFWNIMLGYKLTNTRNAKIIPQYFPLVESDFQIIADLMLLNLKNDKNRTKLTSEIYESSYECDFKVKIPNRLSGTKRNCRLDLHRNESIFKQEINPCSLVNSENFTKINPNVFEINLNNSFLPVMNHCDDMPKNSQIYKMLCSPREHFLIAKKERDIEFCFFNTFEGKPCLLNVWLKEEEDFYYTNNETIFVRKYNTEFNSEEWVGKIDNENEIFLCGSEIPVPDERKFFNKANYLITRVLIKVSILFLIVHLIFSATENKLQSLPNKIMYSYSLTLLGIYILWDMGERLSSCMILSIIIHYLSLSCFAWLLIASYDCWLVICHSSAKFQTFAGKSRLKRYLFYCFWGWISPLSIIAIALYFELAPNNKVPCYLKPGYGRLKQCFIAQESPLNYFYHYPTAVITCLNISLFSHTFYHIFKNKRKDITSTLQNTNSYIIFVRLSLNMGIVVFMVLLWALYILVIKTDFILFHTVQNIFQAAQGIFMFLLFSFDRQMIKKITIK